MANINLPYLHYCPRWGGISETFWAILSRAVLTQYWHVGQTDGQTHNNGIYSAHGVKNLSVKQSYNVENRCRIVLDVMASIDYIPACCFVEY